MTFQEKIGVCLSVCLFPELYDISKYTLCNGIQFVNTTGGSNCNNHSTLKG
jgi:hypothetical protein